MIAFNEGGVRLSDHDIGYENVIHCDSTGTIVANCKSPALWKGVQKRHSITVLLSLPPRRKNHP